jgi:hypothetical protein
MRWKLSAPTSRKRATRTWSARVVADLAGKASADEVRAKLKELLPVAKAQLMSEL